MCIATFNVMHTSSSLIEITADTACGSSALAVQQIADTGCIVMLDAVRYQNKLINVCQVSVGWHPNTLNLVTCAIDEDSQLHEC